MQLFGGILEGFSAATSPRAEKVMSKRGMKTSTLCVRRQIATPRYSDERRMIPVQHGHSVCLPLHDVARQCILNSKDV